MENGFFRNLIVTLILLTACVVGAFWARDNGILKPRPQAIAPNETTETPATEVEATPTPLPAHFPETEGDLSREFHGEKSLDEALHVCWPNHPIPDDVTLDATALEEENLTKLFGKIERREDLEGGRMGLLFSAAGSTFAPRAVGSAIKSESPGRFQHIQIRAAGRMLQCETRGERVLCECI